MHPNCEAVNDILQAAGLPGRVQMLDEAVSYRACCGCISRMSGRRHRQLVDLRHRSRDAAVDHDQWRASGRHDQSRRAARG